MTLPDPLRYQEAMHTCAYSVVVEPDESGWHSYCPAQIRLDCPGSHLVRSPRS
jgi:hypothetical protein